MMCQLSEHSFIVYLRELNCCPAGGGLEGVPDPPKPPPPPPKAGADPEAIDPKVGALAALPKAGGLLETLPNVDPPPPPPNVDPIDGAAPKLADDPKAGGDPKVAAPPNPAAGFVGVLLLFCWNPKP